MDDLAVLVLNYTYEPLHFTNAKRAITLLLSGKAESVESSPRVVRSPSPSTRRTSSGETATPASTAPGAARS